MNRRDFIRLGAVGAGVALLGVEAGGGESGAASSSSKVGTTIGMPISVAPLVTGDLDSMFDDMRGRAGVNALFPFIYSHEAAAFAVL
jgi:hypothetical protein